MILHQTKTIEVDSTKCNQQCEKRKGLFYVDDLCGNKSKYKLTYTLKNKFHEKYLCIRHLKSNEAWLKRINISYETKQISE